VLHDFHRWPGSLALILYSPSWALLAAQNAPFAGLTQVSAEQFVAAIFSPSTPRCRPDKPLGRRPGAGGAGSCAR